MRYQLLIAKYLFKQKIYKVVIFLFSFFFLLILIEFLNPRDTEQDTLCFLLGIISDEEASFLETLWIAFQIVSVIYILYSYLMYEEDHSPEFMLLRTNFFFVLKNKTIIFLLILLIFRLILFLIVMVFFNKYIYFPPLVFVVNIIMYMFIAFIALLCYVIFIRKRKL